MSLAAAILFVGLGVGVLSGIDDAEAAPATEITIAPGMKYTYTPTFPSDLNPTVTIKSQGVGANGTGGDWGTVSGKTLTVNVPKTGVAAGSTYQVTLLATTTNPTQSVEIPILFNIAANASASGSQANIVTGTAINFTPSVTGMGSFTWAVTSGKNLPAGLSLNAANGKVTGTPTGMGDQTIHLTATSSYGEKVNLTVTFKIVSKLVPTNEPSEGAIIYVI
ncbi:MAG TPA: putative Ig domain-containing protein [Candidatus Methanomethylophilaceae archaeon]|nr:putative Ig domain-containing protein [Candidatus Methanomethylophilaceae archaeon]